MSAGQDAKPQCSAAVGRRRRWQGTGQSVLSAALLACAPTDACVAAIAAEVGAMRAAVDYSTQNRQRQGLLDPSIDRALLGGETDIAPTLPGESVEDTGPQFLVRAKPRRQWFEAIADSQFYYTSNFTLNEEGTFVGEEDTAMLVSTAQFALCPVFDVASGRISPRLGYRHQWYNYDIVENEGRNNAFDFDSQTVFAEINWYLPGDDWRIFGGFEWRRLLGHEGPSPDYAEFYKEYVPYWGADRFFRFADWGMLQLRYESQVHLTAVDPMPDASINDRIEHYITINYAHAIRPDLVVRPFYRFAYYDYLHGTWGDRNDTIHSLGVTVTWRIASWLDLRVFFVYDHKESDDELVPDYRKFDAGPGVMAVCTF